MSALPPKSGAEVRNETICTVVLTLIALCLASATFAQEALKGEVTTVDEASRTKIEHATSGAFGFLTLIHAFDFRDR